MALGPGSDFAAVDLKADLQFAGEGGALDGQIEKVTLLSWHDPLDCYCLSWQWPSLLSSSHVHCFHDGDGHPDREQSHSVLNYY